jgi:hypothetical protein
VADLKISAAAGQTGGPAETADLLGEFLRKDGQYAVPLPPDYEPSDHGIQAWTFDPALSSASQAITSESLYVMSLLVRAPVAVNNILIAVSSAGTGTVTAAGAGLYNSSGTRLGHNTSTGWGTAAAGVQTLALTVDSSQSLTLQPGTYFVAVFAEQASTVASLAASGAKAATLAAGLGAAAYRASVNGTSVTTLPTSLTLSSNSLTSAFPFWAGLS